MHYHKLIRDLVPDQIRSKGETCVTHIADDPEYWQKLKEKLEEEVIEFQTSEEVAELADLLEVVDAILAFKLVSKEELSRIKDEKAAKRGMFEKRIILDES